MLFINVTGAKSFHLDKLVKAEADGRKPSRGRSSESLNIHEFTEYRPTEVALCWGWLGVLRGNVLHIPYPRMWLAFIDAPFTSQTFRRPMNARGLSEVNGTWGLIVFSFMFSRSRMYFRIRLTRSASPVPFDDTGRYHFLHRGCQSYTAHTRSFLHNRKG